jgi:hypothetical protein
VVNNNANAVRVSATAEGALTAPPPAQNQTAADAGAGFKQSVTTTTIDPPATTVAHEGSVEFGRQLLVSPPSAANAFATGGPLAGSSADLSGAAIRMFPVGGALAFANVPATQAGSTLADEAALEIAAPAILGADLLNGTGPRDPAALDLGVHQFIVQLDDLGREISRSLQETGIAPWIVAAALGAVAFEVARRRRSRRVPGFAGGPNYLADSWVPGLSGPLGSEEA